MTTSDREQALAVVTRVVTDADLEHEGGARDGELVVTLPGDKKLKTVVSLVVGDNALSVSAFVIRNADENHEEFYRYLLRRNLRMPLLAYSIDASGDVYVGGRIPLRAVTDELVDQVLGVVLEAADAPFNELLLLGFRSSMQKEWDWRVSRGESLRNLEAFRAVLERTDGPAEA
ncbi:YbjN domain-containing protein [Janibacter terrae]|uniref:YbjN domain-containing protein n=1 Tax=Janibacter terrae TaxID=103817 RepID=A0ABZ2FJK3_9MICO|nr:YbjN domain-containing protein [Janibacter terrae]HBO54838.1 YbjN domain-containing protein [Janibacter terrae]